MLVGVAVHLPPWHWPGMAPLHPGVPGGEAPEVGDTPDLLIQWGWPEPLPLAMTYQPLLVVPPQSALLVEAVSRPNLPQHCILGSLL